MKNKYAKYLLYLLIVVLVSLPITYSNVSASVRMSVRFAMVLIQLGTLLCAILFFRRMFAQETKKPAAFFGVVLYMTCPYRIFACYDPMDLSCAIIWMLLPLYAWAVGGIVLQKGKIKDIVVAGIVLGGIGYVNTIFFLILVALTMLTTIFLRKPWSIIPVVIGCILCLPKLYKLVLYLFTDFYSELGISIHPIMDNGYRLGEYFHSYVYRDGHPGMGMGILIGLLCGFWLKYVYGTPIKNQICKFFGVLSIGLFVLSFYRFPWDIFQRFGGWSLKLISLINTPAIFAGLAFMCLIVPAAWGVASISEHKNKVIAYAIPVMVLIFCMGLCIHQGTVLG